jgi:hypothetical protein
MSQQNKTTLQSNINSQLADNTSGDISAADVRNNLINITDSLLFNSGSQGITGSLTILGTTTVSGSIIPSVSKSFSLGSTDFPFKDIYISSGSLNISSDNPGAPSTTLSNVSGNILISAGGMQLLGSGSFNAATGSFQYISGSMTQLGNYTQFGNYTMQGNKTITGSLSITGSSKVNGYDTVTQNTNAFNPQFKSADGTTAGIAATGSYTLMNNLCYFRIYVDFAGCTNFGGATQYQMTLPFSSSHTFTTRDGHLHQLSGDSKYHIAGICEDGSGENNILKLYYFGSTTDLNWKSNTPVGATTTTSHFDLSGWYEYSL